MFSKTALIATLAVASLALGTACTFHPPAVVFPAGVLVAYDNDRADAYAEAMVGIDKTNLKTDDYFYYLLAKSHNRGNNETLYPASADYTELNGVTGTGANNEILISSLYRSIDEMLYGSSDTNSHMGSSTITRIQNNPDGTSATYDLGATTTESYEIIIGAASRCANGRSRTGSPDKDIFLRASYRVTVTINYNFTHGVDETNFRTGAAYESGAVSYSGLTAGEPMLIQHKDVALQSTVSEAFQVVTRQDVSVSSSLTPNFGGGANSGSTENMCLDNNDNAGGDQLLIGLVDSTGNQGTAYGTDTCSFTAQAYVLRVNRTATGGPEGAVDSTPTGDLEYEHTPLLHHIHVTTRMSQFAQGGAEPDEPADFSSYPASFDVAVNGTMTDQTNDIRFDICYVKQCMEDDHYAPEEDTDGSCTDAAVVSDLPAFVSTASSNADATSALAWCQYKPFAADSAGVDSELGDTIYSPFAYVRAWFTWDNGDTIESVENDAGVGTNTNDYADQPARRLLRSAAKKVAKKVPEMVQHSFHFKVQKAHH